MKIIWNIDNGHINPMPDQEIEIDDEDLEDMNEEEIKQYIDDIVYDEFCINICYYWGNVSYYWEIEK